MEIDSWFAARNDKTNCSGAIYRDLDDNAALYS